MIIEDFKLPSVTEELTLLGHWATNNHREDINYISEELFAGDYAKLYSGIKKGLSISQLSEQDQLCGLSISQLIDYGSSYPTTDRDFVTYAEARSAHLFAQKGYLINKLQSKKTTDVKKVLKELEEIQSLIENEEYKPKAKEYSENYISDLLDRSKNKQPQYGQGFEGLDYWTGGIRKGQLTVLGARPSVGKSAFACQVALNVATQGYKVMYLPLEMTTNEILERLVLQSQTAESEELTKPTEATVSNIKAFLDTLEKEGNLIIYEGLNQLTGIEKKIKEEKPYMVIIDQLTQVRPSGRSRDNREKYIECTRELKRMAIEHHINIFLLSQLNRVSTDKGTPSIESLHESDSTGQDADNVFTLYTPNGEEREENEYYDSERETTLYIAKQRAGVSNKKIYMNFRGYRQTFESNNY